MFPRPLALRPIAFFLTAAAVCSLIAPASAQSTTRVSVTSAGGQANGGSYSPAISADGRYVAFESVATNLVAGDANASADVFLHDRATGQTILISADAFGFPGNGASQSPTLSADGRFVTFSSFATNLIAADLNGGLADVYLHDRLTGQNSLVSLNSQGVQADKDCINPSISANGACVVFKSKATNLVLRDTNNKADVFLRDLQAGKIYRMSVSSTELQANGHSGDPVVSADGMVVAFRSEATNLDGFDLWADDIYVRDRHTGQTSRVSVSSLGWQASALCFSPTISPTGRFVSFVSMSNNLSRGDGNRTYDTFVRDRVEGRTMRISEAASGAESNGFSYEASLAAVSAGVVVYASDANNLVPGDVNGAHDVILRDKKTGLNSLVSVSTEGTQGNSSSLSPSISQDGRFVVFVSGADNLVPGDSNAEGDIFVRDRGPDGLTLTLSGSCPSQVSLLISHASPGGRVGIFTGPAGQFVQSSPPCPGLALDLGAPLLRSLTRADVAGLVIVAANMPAGLCGQTMQAVDFTSCKVSNAVVL